jgi:DNA-directed RNA polymerase subunit H (RpoH/RPB5)
MMNDRGYDLPENEKDLHLKSDLSVGALYLTIAKNAQCSIALAMSCTYVKDETSILVLFLDNNYDEGKKREKMVSTDQVKAGIQLWKNSFESSNKCIFVCPGKLSPDAKKEVSIPNLITLSHEFLFFPIGRHIMVPPHKALTKNECEMFELSRKLLACQLPQIKISDPVSLYYGFELGSIIKISRPGWEVHRVVAS